MPPQDLVTLHSAQLKAPIDAAMEKVDKAIQQGQDAVKSSQAALDADPGNAAKKQKLQKNKELLATAEKLKAGLQESEKIANMMCPLQVAMLQFDYTS